MDGQNVLEEFPYKTMKSVAFWKHEQELLSNKFMAFLESHAQGGAGGWKLICVLEAFGPDGERYACVSKKSEPLFQRATVPMISPDGVSWEISLEKGNKNQSGTLQKPQ